MNYKYDVAISCAEEDLPIAEQIAQELKAVNISYYLYTEHSARHWGENIFQVSLDVYKTEARFVLMIISKIYVTKYWAGIENQIAGTVQRLGEAYILPLRLDDTPVDGISKNIKFEKWKNDARAIAELIKQKLTQGTASDATPQQIIHKTYTANIQSITESGDIHQNFYK